MQFECDFDEFPNTWTKHIRFIFVFNQSYRFKILFIKKFTGFYTNFWDCFVPLYWFDWKLHKLLYVYVISRFPISNALSGHLWFKSRVFFVFLKFSFEYGLLNETLEIAMVFTYVEARFTVIYCDATNAREMNKRK